MSATRSAAAGTFLGILAFVGACALAVGIFGLVTMGSPIVDAEDQIANRGHSGEYVPNVERDGIREIGKARSELKQRNSIIATSVGLVCVLPLGVILVSKNRS